MKLVTFRNTSVIDMRYEWNRDLIEGMVLSHSRPQDAIELLRSGLAKTPAFAEGHFALGGALRSVGQPGEAETLMRQRSSWTPLRAILPRSGGNSSERGTCQGSTRGR